MNGFERRKKEKTETILQAASKLFMERGVKAVTIADLADQAHVSPVTIFNYFGSKDNLAKQVLFAYLDRKMAEGEVLMSSDLAFREKCEAILLFKLEVASDSTLELLKHVHMSDPDVQRLLQEYYETKTTPLLIDFIEQGKREGCIDPDLSTESVLLYMEVFRGALARPDFYSALSKKVIQDLVSLFFHGLLRKPGEE